MPTLGEQLANVFVLKARKKELEDEAAAVGSEMNTKIKDIASEFGDEGLEKLAVKGLGQGSLKPSVHFGYLAKDERAMLLWFIRSKEYRYAVKRTINSKTFQSIIMEYFKKTGAIPVEFIDFFAEMGLSLYKEPTKK